MWIWSVMYTPQRSTLTSFLLFQRLTVKLFNLNLICLDCGHGLLFLHLLSSNLFHESFYIFIDHLASMLMDFSLPIAFWSSLVPSWLKCVSARSKQTNKQILILSNLELHFWTESLNGAPYTRVQIQMIVDFQIPNCVWHCPPLIEICICAT